VLTQSEVVPYLLKRGLVKAESIVAGDLVVTDVSRRNRNYMVVSEQGPSYLLKQGVGPSGRATLAHEAAVYQLLEQGIGDGAFQRYLPHCYGYDEQERMLILEFLRDGQTLREYYRKGNFSLTIARAVGDALGSLHRCTKTFAKQGVGIEHFPGQLPSIHRPDLSMFQQVSSANLQLIKIVQHVPEIGNYLDELRRGWTTEALIHHDLKWDNYIVFAKAGARRKTRLVIVDWEMADRGDPCWDIAAVFNDYLSAWVLSMPITGEAPPEHFVGLARFPLESMWPAMHEFWKAYVRQMELSAEMADEWLWRSINYTGARMIQTAFEHLQTEVRLASTTRCLLELGMNILRQPLEAFVSLLGFSLHPLEVL
jgi:aminoglycoside phosphotransferase (APT) family kinase protein